MNIGEIGKRIKTVRLEREMTLQDIADNIGLTKSTIQRYESGTIKQILLPVIDAIAQTLRVNPAWLLGKSAEKEPINGNENEFTEQEKALINKYRSLDNRGRTNVDNLLEIEYQFALKQRKEKKEDYEPTTIAAHNEGEWTKAHDRDVARVRELARKKKEREKGM